MRIDTAGAVALLLAIVPAYAQTDAAAAPTSPDRTYRLLREDEDWSFLKDPILRKDFWDPIKYIPLRATDWYVTVGGEIREALERVANDNWGKQPYMNTFLLERYMLHTDWHMGKHFCLASTTFSGRRQL